MKKGEYEEAFDIMVSLLGIIALPVVVILIAQLLCR